MSAAYTLEKAVALARQIEAELAKVGWHCALTGGCLYRGQSDKDIDIVIYPAQKRSRGRQRSFRPALRRAGLSLHMSCAKLRAHWRKRGILDEKHVEMWVAYGIGRVDVMVLS